MRGAGAGGSLERRVVDRRELRRVLLLLLLLGVVHHDAELLGVHADELLVGNTEIMGELELLLGGELRELGLGRTC